MPYRDPEKRKQASKDSMGRKRKGLTLGINKDDIKEGVNKYPAVLYALMDDEPDPQKNRRLKLEKIYHSLNDFKVSDKVFYGYPGLGGVPFDVVGNYLEATNG